ncbi:putative quinol monooxygenase [Metabacillus sp. 113a]|uniref:putative quinol monooxygenase n=1 Tax=Metabacillus sp. 113a TaxID=3404706 RepID=UPI003CF00A31
MGKFGLYGRLTAKEGKREELAAILLEAAESMKELPGCELYVVSLAEDERESVYIYEVWSNEEAHQASLGNEATKMLIKQARPIIADMDRITTLKPLGGKGL